MCPADTSPVLSRLSLFLRRKKDANPSAILPARSMNDDEFSCVSRAIRIFSSTSRCSCGSTDSHPQRERKNGDHAVAFASTQENRAFTLSIAASNREFASLL